MISNMPNKKKEDEKLENDEVLAELLKEIDSPSAPVTPSFKRKRDLKDLSPWTVKRAEKDYVRTLQSTISRPPPTRLINQINQKNQEVQAEKLQMETPHTSNKEQNLILNKLVEPRRKEFPSNSGLYFFIEQCICFNIKNFVFNIYFFLESSPPLHNDNFQEEKVEHVDVFNDDFDLSHIEDSFDITETTSENVEIDMSEWISTNEANVEEVTIGLKNSDLPLIDRDDKKMFRFFWWDAFEDPIAQPGVVFLFGKVYQETKKSHLSCCVAVRNIERRIYFLPRVAVCVF